MPFTGPLEDRLAIRELYDSYADAGSRADREGWLGCFTSDAHWKTHYFDLHGIAEIAAKYDEIMGGVSDTTFFCQMGSIEIEGDTARVRMQQSESLLYPDGSTFDLVGEYNDVCVKRDGRWWFAEKIYLVKREKAPVPAEVA